MKAVVNKLMNRINLLVLSCLLAAAQPLFAQSKYAGEPFSIGVGARGLGMGSAFHTLATGPEALYWNPAGLSRTEGERPHSFVFMHSERFGGEVSYNFVGYSRRLEQRETPLTVALGLIHLGVGGIPVTGLPDPDRPPGEDNRPVIERYVSKNDFALIAGLGRKLGERHHIGANFKLLHERYLDVTATGFGFDIGAVFAAEFRGVSLLWSLSARDVTTSFLAFSTGKREYIKPWLSGGVALAEGVRIPGGLLRPAVEISVPLESRRRNYRSDSRYLMSLLHLGAEYSMYERMFLRGGLDENNPSFGAGFILRGLAADYAWVGHRDLEQTHRVSLGYSF
ncbi:MAG: hypothetical protein FVQ81_09005 [Candidatus Glassbacteria bacterium]|nr:hypothetical protein [Candidatus Glassbacteria bacterium]